MTILPSSASPAPFFTPAIILVRPQLGENIGAAARVMKNFGFTDLRIVAPRDGWPNPKAESMAAGGLDVLQGAQLFESTRAAVADLQQLYATTARPREMVKEAISMHDLGSKISERWSAHSTCAPALSPSHSASSRRAEETNIKTGILFGPERSGLENEDIALADTIVYVPVNPDYPSLNLAQTVALAAYECSKYCAEAVMRAQPDASRCNNAPRALYTQGHHPERQSQPERSEQAPATKDEISGFFDQLEAALDARNFWKVAEKKPQMWINIRNLFGRAQLTQQEVRTLRGLVRSLSER